MTSSTTTPCDQCKNTGILFEHLYLYESDPEWLSFSADHVTRCDECTKYNGDLEAARALASQSRHGCWMVWAENYDGRLPATEKSNIYVRNDPATVATVMQGIMRDSEDEFGIPLAIPKMEFVKQGTLRTSMYSMILNSDADSVSSKA